MVCVSESDSKDRARETARASASDAVQLRRGQEALVVGDNAAAPLGVSVGIWVLLILK